MRVSILSDQNYKSFYLCLNPKAILENKRIIPSKDKFWQGKMQSNLLALQK